MPSAKVKSRTATRCMVAMYKAVIISGFRGNDVGGGRTGTQRSQALGLFDETVDDNHPIERGLGPTLLLYDRVNFRTQQFQIFGLGREVV